MTSPTVASLLRAYRNRLGLTQRGFAAATGMSVAAIADIEQGRHRVDDGILLLLLSDLLIARPVD